MNAPYDRKPKEKKPRGPLYPELVWWTTLIISVMSVPLVSTTAAILVTEDPTLQMLLFILTNWACVWAGIKLVKWADGVERRFRNRQ